jgi:hypothetical protein
MNDRSSTAAIITIGPPLSVRVIRDMVHGGIAAEPELPRR